MEERPQAWKRSGLSNEASAITFSNHRVPFALAFHTHNEKVEHSDTEMAIVAENLWLSIPISVTAFSPIPLCEAQCYFPNTHWNSCLIRNPPR